VTPAAPPPIVAFDLDGTLVDSAEDLALALNRGLAELGLEPIDAAIVRTFVGHGATKLVERALGHLGQSLEATPELLGRFRRHYEDTLTGATRPYAGIVEMLAALKPWARLAVATNKPGHLARPLVAALFPATFDLVLGPDDVGTLKPDPAILARIARELGGEVIAFVGDSAVDTETARAAGVLDIGVLWGLRPEEARSATRTARTPGDLAALLLPRFA
jgi:phosphoglycolate phosphatase